MKNLRYNLIKGPKATVNDYLETLSNDELLATFSSSVMYGLNAPQLTKQMQAELLRRNIAPQPALF